ncbi:MAG: phosphoribosyltransferase family protein [Patescibacteria group bacterium]
MRQSPLAGIWWPWRYQNEKTKKIIAAYKYRNKEWLALILSTYIENVLDMRVLQSDIVVIPVPLSDARLKARGFNQALLLAKNLPFPVLNNVAVRTKDTPSQARTHSRRERIDHMRGAFSIKNKAKIAGRTILLIDDVATTGATLCELASELKKAGSGQIYAAVLAHG